MSIAPGLPRKAPLGLPFALIGLTGAWLTVGAMMAGRMHAVAVTLAVSTPVLSAAVGVVLGRLGVAGWAGFGRLFALTLVAGALNGVLATLAVEPRVAPFGLVYGVAFAVPFLLPFGLVLLAAREVGAARAGSRLDGAARRRVWLTTAWVCMVGSLAGLQFAHGSVLAFAFAFAAFALAAAALALDTAALVAARRSRTLPAWDRPEAVPFAAVVEDLGLGDHTRVMEPPGASASAYRGVEPVPRVVRGDPRRVARALVAALVIDAMAGATGAVVVARVLSAVPREVHHPVAPVPPAPVPASADASAAPEIVRTLAHIDWNYWDVKLLGIDPAHHHAYVRLETPDPAPRWVIDTLDYATGARVDRWEASPENARRLLSYVDMARDIHGYPPAFHPISGGFDEDLRRVASIVRATGTPMSSPDVNASPDGTRILFDAIPTDRHDGDWLWMADGDGGNRHRVAPALRTNYNPLFSPDGARFAWSGCCSPRRYALWVARSHDAMHPVRVRGVPTPTIAYEWTPDGEALWVLGEPSPGQTCLERVGATAPFTARTLRCVTGLRDVSLAVAPDRRTAVLAGRRGPTDSPIVDYTWLRLDDGSLLAEHSVERGASAPVLGPDGTMLTSSQGRLAAMDLATGVLRPVPEAETYLLVFAPLWTEVPGSGRLLLGLRGHRGGGGFDLVGIDTERMLRGR